MVQAPENRILLAQGRIIEVDSSAGLHAAAKLDDERTSLHWQQVLAAIYMQANRPRLVCMQTTNTQ